MPRGSCFDDIRQSGSLGGDQRVAAAPKRGVAAARGRRPQLPADRRGRRSPDWNRDVATVPGEDGADERDRGQGVGAMTCDRVRSLIAAYLDRELDALTAREVANHLTECKGCQVAADNQAALSRAIRANYDYARAPERLVARARKATVGRHRPWSVPWSAALVAGTAMGAALVSMVWQPWAKPDPLTQE